MSGTQDVIIAGTVVGFLLCITFLASDLFYVEIVGGVELMSTIPIGSNIAVSASRLY